MPPTDGSVAPTLGATMKARRKGPERIAHTAIAEVLASPKIKEVEVSPGPVYFIYAAEGYGWESGDGSYLKCNTAESAKGLRERLREIGEAPVHELPPVSAEMRRQLAEKVRARKRSKTLENDQSMIDPY